MIYTTNISESCLYSVCLEKQIDLLKYIKIWLGVLFIILIGLYFNVKFVDKIHIILLIKFFQVLKCGIINPKVDKNWKRKINDYLTYIHKERELWYEVFVRDDPIVKSEEFKKEEILGVINEKVSVSNVTFGGDDTPLIAGSLCC